MDILDPSLEQFAIRDLTEVVPGRRYALVHSQKDAQPMYDYESGTYINPPPPFVQVIWVTAIVSDKVVYPNFDHVKGVKPVICYKAEGRDYTWGGNPSGLSTIHASDAGVWNAPNAYKNQSNYLLDLDDLAKYAGVVVTNNR